jgi:hypothetical protein
MRVRDSELLLPSTIVGAYPRPLFMHGTKVFTWGSDAPECQQASGVHGVRRAD